jgi:dephospho-CoA kinase
MKQYKIAIAGKQGSGKSYLAAALANVGWLTFSIADPIKQLVNLAYPQASKTDAAIVQGQVKTIRELYQALGGGVRNHVDEYFWLNIATNRINDAARTFRSIVIDDVRTPTEAMWLQNVGFTVVKLVVPAETRAARIGKLIGEKDHTEEGVEDIEADIVMMPEQIDYFVKLLDEANWSTFTTKFENAHARAMQYLETCAVKR